MRTLGLETYELHIAGDTDRGFSQRAHQNRPLFRVMVVTNLPIEVNQCPKDAIYTHHPCAITTITQCSCYCRRKIGSVPQYLKYRVSGMSKGKSWTEHRSRPLHKVYQYWLYVVWSLKRKFGGHKRNETQFVKQRPSRRYAPADIRCRCTPSSLRICHQTSPGTPYRPVSSDRYSRPCCPIETFPSREASPIPR